ncbi:hypothetical protein [Methylobacterium planeticum]|uniref:hypothetical protein n=1 Tax=Methylobacterium planeticum TaxID=2615211 RepID=UPI00177E67B9|nr:hypothetical protein [Methylobacterium planeticum]
MMIAGMVVEIAEAVSDGLAGGAVLASILLAGWALGARHRPRVVPVRVRAGRR